MKTLISSIIAGIMIVIGSCAYLKIGGPIGAFVFSIGLLTIIYFKFTLFTGKIGFIKSYKELPYILTILLGNAIGCCLMFAFPSAAAGELLLTKLASPLWLVFVKGMLCNILIYIAVASQKTEVIILSVMSFILCGFEHSIADLCFIISAQCFTIKSLIFFLVVVLGNAVGAILFHQARRYIREDSRNT